MTIIYEVNPPKIPPGITLDDNHNYTSTNTILDDLISNLRQRVTEISSICGGIHVTDSVLGTRRVSALHMGSLLKKDHPHLQITISMRVRNKNIPQLEKIVKDSILYNLDGILVIMGDPSKTITAHNTSDSNLIPSYVTTHFTESDFGNKTKFYLSLPAMPNFEKIQKKINAKPTGFITQVIDSSSQVLRICDNLKPQGFDIIPCVLLPSQKNTKSRDFLNLDWSSYQQNPAGFINEINDIAGNVLVTSPNDFIFAKETLTQLSF
jgi:homocysteine S-methyltransferase